MEEYFPELHSSGRKVKIELHVCNYPTKADLKMEEVLILQILLKWLI